MTDDLFADEPGYDAVHDPFHDEVRRMLRRRAADVADHGVAPAFAGAAGGPWSGAGPDHRMSSQPAGAGGAEVLALPESELGLRTTGSVDRGLPGAGRDVPWTRRLGLVAAAAAVLVTAAVGLLSWRDDARPVTVGAAGETTGLLLLPPEGDEVELVSMVVSDAEQLTSAGDVLLGYGPTEAMIDDGLVVLVEPVEGLDPSSPMPGLEEVAVTAEQDPVLAERGAFAGPDMVSWRQPADDRNPERSIAVFAYGSQLSDDEVLTVAGRIAVDVDRILDGDDLPDGWALQIRVDDSAVTDTVEAELGGAFEGWFTTGGVPVPLGLFGSGVGDGDGSMESESISVRGTTGALATIRYTEEEPSEEFSVVRLAWLEGNALHQITAMAPVAEVLALAERLEPVDAETARRRRDEVGPLDEQVATTSVPVTATTAVTSVPTTASAPGSSTTGPPFSMTAPGPGAVALGGDGSSTTGTATTGPPTTIPNTSGTGPVTSGPPTTPPEPTVVVTRPTGSFTDNSIVPVPVDDATIGDTPYEVGVSWSPRFGLCLGIDLDGDLIGGGYPVECEISPWIGGGGRREVPGVGTIVFAFAPDEPRLASAELVVGDEEVDVTIHRIDAFPEFAFLIAPVEGVSADEIDRLSLPGAFVLLDEAGRPLGWG